MLEKNSTVYTRENNPRLTLVEAYIRRERNYLYDYGLHKTQTARMNGSGLSLRPDHSWPEMTWFVFVPPVILQQWLKRAKMGNTCLLSGKSSYFTLPFSFQINILVKISIGLLENLCGSVNEKFLSDQSSSLKEMLRWWMKWSLDEISGSLVQQVIFPPLQRASFSLEGLGCNWKQSMGSYRSRLQ